MFRFKQFGVDQSGCAMKINTDGVLLGAMAEADNPSNILDIGTGTGVIALMAAQRYATAEIDAVEIDEDAAQTAGLNFRNSPFTNKLTVFPLSFERYFEQFPERKYDLIVSNPPFYIDSLKSPGPKKALAKHTDVDFFEKLVKAGSAHLTDGGCLWFVLPGTMAEMIIELSTQKLLYPKKVINIKSYTHSDLHRVVICFTFDRHLPEISNFTIYKAKDIYSDEYTTLLQPYFLAF